MTGSSSVTELEVDAHSNSDPEPGAETEMDYESDDGVLDEVSADAMEDLELEDALDEPDVQSEVQKPGKEKPGAAVHPDNLDTLPYEPVKSLEPEQAEDTAPNLVASSGEENTDEEDQKANCNKETHAV